jgi:peptidoglycan/xylan/chitin deacetylase (PgdA/CDA1 family)
MSFQEFRNRCRGYYQRRAARFVVRRPFVINTTRPVVSFTFDDFPRSALAVGGAILSRHGLAGTYYASLGLMGRDSPSGKIFVADDLPGLFAAGHELGCHTFSHCHSWETETEAFNQSISDNRAALKRLNPGADFKTFSYPISEPRPRTKARTAPNFLCCRCGGQTLNVGTTDLNQLASYFLEKTGGDLRPVKEIIERNRRERGWLIFSTHDIADHPSPFGCTPKFFESVVAYAIESGASVLPVVSALKTIGM